MKKVAIHNLGCKVNAYELDKIAEKLREKGYQIVPFESVADVYIVNTCTVTNVADKKSRQMLHRAKRRNPKAIVVALGCYVRSGEEEWFKEAGIDLALGNDRKAELPGLLDDLLRDRQAVCQEPGDSCEEASDDIERCGRTRAYLKIQDGCNQFCSYCIIPYVRGRITSRPAGELKEEVEKLAGAGYKEIVLTGIHISSYGLDFGNRQKGEPANRALLDLIRELAGVEGIERLRLGSLEPRLITKDFVEELAGIREVCPHFHLSLQSGCNATLKRMNRRYTTEEYYERVVLLRKAYGRPAITTDVIVGFPGETEEEFAQTKRFLERVNIYEMHVFKYSVRKGTPAASMPDQVPEQVKALRSGELIGLREEQSQAFRRQMLGSRVKILTEDIESRDGCLYRVGYTPDYVKAAIPAVLAGSNQILSARVRGLLGDCLLTDIQE